MKEPSPKWTLKKYLLKSINQSIFAGLAATISTNPPQTLTLPECQAQYAVSDAKQYRTEEHTVQLRSSGISTVVAHGCKCTWAHGNIEA